MTTLQKMIFGPDESDRHDVYFSTINQYYFRANKSYHSLCRDIKTLDNGDQESEDFESDIMSAIKDIEVAKMRLGQKIDRHRKAIGW